MHSRRIVIFRWLREKIHEIYISYSSFLLLIYKGPICYLKWWQWILSIDTSTQPNPFTTVYQGDCRQLLQGNTMFLVGQFPPGSVSNHGVCNVSAQTALLVPVIIFVDIDCTSKQQQSPNKPPGLCTFDITTPAGGQPFKQLRDIVSDCTVNPGCVDQATNMAASIDGVPLPFVRVQSPPGGFEVRLAPNDPFGANAGPVTLHGVSDGYWVLIPSLPPGQHMLTFGGCLPTLGCQTNTYTLIVS
jgi:hypothetical protein